MTSKPKKITIPSNSLKMKNWNKNLNIASSNDLLNISSDVSHTLGNTNFGILNIFLKQM